MEPNIFQDILIESSLRSLYNKMVVWVKAQSIMGLILQMFTFCFAYLHLKTYYKYRDSYPTTALTYLFQAIFEGMTIVFSTIIYGYWWRCANRIKKALSSDGTTGDFESGIRLNIQLLIAATIWLVLTIGYYFILIVPALLKS